MNFKDLTVKERTEFTCRAIQKRRAAKAKKREIDYVCYKRDITGKAQKLINHRKQGGVFY